ncbi:thaumatin-like protein [Musa troglodytarum]|uniref:Thaumatin-like protein n=1 Tax=Musa troglodytarum TaxID=320322 RepID=A0A9E7KW30_9LILI|nr:thaumatin-like protein [Musa troglodytarum]
MASSTILSFLLFALLLTLSRAAEFKIVNGCPFTVWAAAIPGGGLQLDQGQIWPIDVNPGTTGGRIWARTGCSFDGSGRGRCRTGDCGGLLECQGSGSPPNTLAEFALNQFENLDFFDISLLDGFNVPMEFSPITGNCTAIRNCPDAYSYPKDDATSTFTCPGGSDYMVIFCPSGSSLPADGYPTRFGRIARCRGEREDADFFAHYQIVQV